VFPILKGIVYQLSIFFQQRGRSRAQRGFLSNDLFAPLAAGTNREVPLNSPFAPPEAARTLELTGRVSDLVE